MKNIFTALLAMTFATSVWAAEKPKYGPAGAPRAVPIALDHKFLTKSEAPDYWALTGFYVPQITDSACSVASVAMVLNAAIPHASKTSDTKNILQADLLEEIKINNWKARLSAAGHQGKHGLPLPLLKEVTEASFKKHGFPKVKVTIRHIEKNDPKTLAQFREDLIRNEKDAKTFIIVNFNQKATTDDADAGHISPVAAYDAAEKRVLIMDSDRSYYEPYWVSDTHVMEGMHMPDSETKKPRGYLFIENL